MPQLWPSFPTSPNSSNSLWAVCTFSWPIYSTIQCFLAFPPTSLHHKMVTLRPLEPSKVRWMHRYPVFLQGTLLLQLQEKHSFFISFLSWLGSVFTGYPTSPSSENDVPNVLPGKPSLRRHQLHLRLDDLIPSSSPASFLSSQEQPRGTSWLHSITVVPS